MQDITIRAYNTKNLIKQAHKIKSIDAANSLYFEENKENSLKIIDKVIIKYRWWDEDRTDEIIKLIDHKSDKNYSNLNILQLFERFKFVFLKMNSSKFKLINISLPFWDKIKFWLNLSSNLEIVTNPMLYQNGVGSLTLSHKHNDIHISDNLISNIWKIKPKSVSIESEKFVYKNESNFIDVLQNLPSKMKFTVKWGYHWTTISLRFSNVVLKIVQNKRKDFTLFEWKSFLYEIDEDNIKNIKFEDHSSEPYLDWLKLILRSNYKVEFEEFNPLTIEQAGKYDNCFPQHNLDNKSWWTIAVLVKDLDSFKLHGPIASLNEPDWNLDRLILKWSGLKYFSHELEFPDHFKYLANIISLFPKNWVFTVKFSFNYV